MPDELAGVEPVALTGNFWVSLPDLDPATGAARSIGVLSEAARALIEFAGAPEAVQRDETRDDKASGVTGGGDPPPGRADAGSEPAAGPLLVPVVEWQGRRIWPPPQAAPPAPHPPAAGSPGRGNGHGPQPPVHYLGGWIPRWFIVLPGPPGLGLELTWLAPVDQRGFAFYARLLPRPVPAPAPLTPPHRGAGEQQLPTFTGGPAAHDPPCPAGVPLQPVGAAPLPAGLRLGLLVRPGAVFRTVYHRRRLSGHSVPYPHRWTRSLVWEAPGTVPAGALALRSATGDEPAPTGEPGEWVFWSGPGRGELIVYGGVAPEGDGAATTAVHLARVGWSTLLGRTLGWLGERDPFRPLQTPHDAPSTPPVTRHRGVDRDETGQPSGWAASPRAAAAAPPAPFARPAPPDPAAPQVPVRPVPAVPAATPYDPASPGPAPSPGRPPGRDATAVPAAPLRLAGLARAVAAGLLTPPEARGLEERLRRNLWFCVFFAHGRTLDGDRWVHLTSRSPRYYVSGAHWTRDSLLWAFPAVLAADPWLARDLLVAAFARYTRYPGEHSQYLDGTVLYPGWELDQAAAWPLSLARYLKATGDGSILDEPAVTRGLVAALDAAEARRDPRTGLVATFLLPSDDPAQQPFVTYDNALYAQALDELAQALARLAPDQPGRPDAPAAGRGAACSPPPARAPRPPQAGAGRAARPGPWLDPGWLEERARITRQAVLAHCVVPGPWGPQFAWAVAGPGGAGAVLYDEPPGTLELLGPYGFARRRSGDGVDVETVYANTVRWIYSAHNPYGPPPGPFSTPTCPHARHPWLLSVAAGLLAGRRAYLAWLARAPMDSGFACETVDAATGRVRTGPAFATCAGFVTWAALVALESLGREAEPPSSSSP
ncbi:hypothetical protein [Thermaerobacter marianensis]|uniref:hypothetical protein n=1 Tax=Thermaerobacter marianensis TaxID=73919 RepID=UPI0002FCE936|nr:hypothetical protein [Thermaerobacter marianensis]